MDIVSSLRQQDKASNTGGDNTKKFSIILPKM